MRRRTEFSARLALLATALPLALAAWSAFSKPFGVAVDGFGRFIVSDTGQAAVFVVDVERRSFVAIGRRC